MSDKDKRQRFVDMVPADVRAETQEHCDARAAARAEFAKKRERARRVNQGRHDGSELGDHDRQVERANEAAREVSQQQARRQRGPKGSSKRGQRRKAFADRGDRISQRGKEHLARYQQKLKELGQWDAAPLGVPAFVWRRAQLIQSDPTGYTARLFLATLPPAIARRIRQQALSPLPYAPRRVAKGRTLFRPTKDKLTGRASLWEGPGQRYWEHPAAIRTVAAGCVLWHLHKPTQRRGFRGVTRGIPRRMMCALLQDPKSGHRPAITTLYGHSRGVPGAVRALEGVLCQIAQPPGDKVRACDRGPSGHAFNVYWFFPWLAHQSTDAERVDAESAVGILQELGLAQATGPPEPAAA